MRGVRNQGMIKDGANKAPRDLITVPRPAPWRPRGGTCSLEAATNKGLQSVSARPECSPDKDEKGRTGGETRTRAGHDLTKLEEVGGFKGDSIGII